MSVTSFQTPSLTVTGTFLLPTRSFRIVCIGENTVRQWINDNQYVWHERQDGKRIDLLCHDIHGNIPHTGGISRNKARKETGS